MFVVDFFYFFIQFSFCPGFINEVDSLVREETISDISDACLYCVFDYFIRVFYPVVHFVSFSQRFKDTDGIGNRWFGDVYLLKVSDETVVLGKISVVFLVGGCSNKAYCARFEVWLYHVCGIQGFSIATSTHEGVDFVNEKNDVSFGFCSFHYCVDALLEISPVMCASQ